MTAAKWLRSTKATCGSSRALTTDSSQAAREVLLPRPPPACSAPWHGLVQRKRGQVWIRGPATGIWQTRTVGEIRMSSAEACQGQEACRSERGKSGTFGRTLLGPARIETGLGGRGSPPWRMKVALWGLSSRDRQNLRKLSPHDMIHRIPSIIMVEKGAEPVSC